MPFNPIHILWLLAHGLGQAHAFPFLQNQRRETASISTSSIDLAHIVTPVTLTTSHTNPSTGTANTPDGTLEAESQQRGTTTSTTLASVSPTLLPSSAISSGYQSTASSSTIMNPSSINPDPSLTPTSRTSTGPTNGAGIDVHMLTLNVPAIIVEQTVTTTVFVMQTRAEPFNFPATPIRVNQDQHRQ